MLKRLQDGSYECEYYSDIFNLQIRVKLRDINYVEITPGKDIQPDISSEAILAVSLDSGKSSLIDLDYHTREAIAFELDSKLEKTDWYKRLSGCINYNAGSTPEEIVLPTNKKRIMVTLNHPQLFHPLTLFINPKNPSWAKLAPNGDLKEIAQILTVAPKTLIPYYKSSNLNEVECTIVLMDNFINECYIEFEECEVTVE